MARTFVNEIVVAIAGQAGQGIQSIEALLGPLVKRSGRHYFSASEFMSRVRGGANSTEIRVASRPVSGYRRGIDLLVALHRDSLPRLASRMSADTVVVGEAAAIAYPGMVDAPFGAWAQAAGGPLYANTAAAGYLAGLLGLDAAAGADFIAGHFAKKGPDAQERNAAAFAAGFAAGAAESGIRVDIAPDPAAPGGLLVAGVDAVALGALAGGCDYVCGYPMSPATSLLERMAALAGRFGVVVEQVEDEVGVVNMALGAWYAGARALVSTSGGGFALMTEGISLAGMIESPLVLHLAQRPGPATGLPTRTEQGDLNLVLYAGHGDFPRIVLAPGTPGQAFDLTRRAFEWADRFQVPVFILTDQFFVDSVRDVPDFGWDGVVPEPRLVATAPGYERYAPAADGISPRGVPGFGSGFVRADSDEHDAGGHITEDLELRVRMVDKRRAKGEAVRAAALQPDLYGPAAYRDLVVCWGSTLGTALEAIEKLGRSDVALLHFSWVQPLPEGAGAYLDKAERVVVVEGNSDGQFARHLRAETGARIAGRVLKYDGLPFDVEGLAADLARVLDQE
jgi:2-oxoglutarate ferredoxin oxidoreductase subunit alpha